MKSRDRGFTLIELLIVVAIIGIIVAISVVNYLAALQRARQRRTMADMRSIGMAVDAYSIDYNFYPPSAAYSLPPGLSLPTDTLVNAQAYVAPTYIQAVPLADGWNSWFNYGTNAEQTDYVIRSAGSDGVAETTPVYGPISTFNQDIIYTDGAFVQFPEGGGR